MMAMTGLESVKNAMIKEYLKTSLSKEQHALSQGPSYNLRLDGNPGTGKSTLANIYGAFLVELGVLPAGSAVECTTGSTLVSNRQALSAHLAAVKKAGGGVIFVDESYQLNPQIDRDGRQILDQILVHAERLTSESIGVPLVWIFAGYQQHMEKLFEHNPGLKSRFPMHFKLDDFSDEELLAIFK